LMQRMTDVTPAIGQSQRLTSINFIRLRPEPEAPPPADHIEKPLHPLESLPEVELLFAEPPPLSLSRMPLQGLAIPALAATHDVIGTPYLGGKLPPRLPIETGLQILRRSPPVYPARALVRKTEGWVKLQLIIDATGKVADARVLDAKPSGVFDAAALKAVRRWRFQAPA